MLQPPFLPADQPKPNNLSDLALRARAGSDEAANELFERCRPALIGAVRRVMVSPIRRLYDSDDFCEEAFLEIFTRDLDPNVLASSARLWRYLQKIAENKVRDAQRKHLIAKRSDISHDVPLDALAEEDLWCTNLSPEDNCILQEFFEERLTHALTRMPLVHREIINHVVKGYCVVDIVKRLHVEPRDVYRAMKWLEKLMVDE